MRGTVSKRQFELKLNQIAQRTKGGDGKSVWVLRPEYAHLQPLAESPSVEMMAVTTIPHHCGSTMEGEN